MKLYAPRYYKKFKCIADRCPHSCCIGWEIDIDANSLNKYKALKDGYGTIIANSIANDGEPHFKLCDGERCPHLDDRGLCRIITNLGEDYLCRICREHPRFYNYTRVAEVGIGMSCPEAARIILSSEDFAEFTEIGEVEESVDGVDFDGCSARNKIYAALQGDYTTALGKLYREYSISIGDDGMCKDLLYSLEYLDEDHRTLFMHYSSGLRAIGKDEYLKRFLAYFIYRHCTEAFNAEDFRLRLSFCLFCERLFASLIYTEEADSLEKISELARIISEEIEYSEDNTLTLTY